MKYVITGGAGNISKPLAEKLLNAGHNVTVIGRNAAHLEPLTRLGAEAAIGSVEDKTFLSKTFTGADAVYTMVPPKWDAADLKAFIAGVGENYAAALREANVKYVVNLSSSGAHLSEGCGPVNGLYRGEQALNKLDGVNIKHLRPAYFYPNLLASIGMIKQAGIMGSNFSIPEKQFPIVDPREIAEAAAEELLALNYKGQSVRYIASDEVSTDAIAAELGKAIGKPDLKWVVFSDDQALQGMLQAGMPEEVAKNYVEMGQAMNNGKMQEEYWKNPPSKSGKFKLNDFAKEFAVAYHAG